MLKLVEKKGNFDLFSYGFLDFTFVGHIAISIIEYYYSKKLCIWMWTLTIGVWILLWAVMYCETIKSILGTMYFFTYLENSFHSIKPTCVKEENTSLNIIIYLIIYNVVGLSATTFLPWGTFKVRVRSTHTLAFLNSNCGITPIMLCWLSIYHYGETK